MTESIITITPANLPNRDAYHLLTTTIIPRPIAWVATVSADGGHNLAPYSFFNAVSGNPPIVMFSVGQRRSGTTKDTLNNIEATQEFVVNLVDYSLAEAMNLTAGEWDETVDEFDLASLERLPSIDVQPPRVAGASVALEAKLTQMIPIEGSDSTMILGQIVRFHIRQDLLDEHGLVDPHKFQPVGRLGGNEYTTFGQIFSLERPLA